MKSFKNKVAAITGAGSGIGRALALELAEQGCHLALSDINLAAVEETATQVLATSPKLRVTNQQLDVADRIAVEAWAGKVVKDHGQVNLVFNNAGVALGSTIEGSSYEDLEWIVNINFWGVVYGTKAFLPHLKKSGDGHVINISSLFGIISVPSQGAYNATKFAVRGFTEALRQELEIEGAPVSTTCVHPGGIKTNIAQAARFSTEMNEFLNTDEKKGKSLIERSFITTSQSAARTILKAVKKNKRRVLVGPDAKAIDLMQRVLPTGYQRVVSGVTQLATRF